MDGNYFLESKEETLLRHVCIKMFGSCIFHLVNYKKEISYWLTYGLTDSQNVITPADSVRGLLDSRLKVA